MVCFLAGNGLIYGCCQNYSETTETSTHYVAVIKMKVVILLILGTYM